MKGLDWQMVWFVGISLVHDFWIHSGLPRIFYFDVKRTQLTKRSIERNRFGKSA